MIPLYVPALKAKMGELQALNELSQEHKGQIMPILEIPDIPFDYEAEEDSKSLVEHLTTVTKLIEKYCGDMPFFLDFLPKIEITTVDGKSSFEIFRSLEKSQNLKYIPVLGFDRNDTYITQAIQAGEEKKTGVCLRAQYDDFDDMYDEDKYTAFTEKYKLQPANTDLVIDLSSVCKETGKTVYLALRLIMSMIPDIKSWRNLIFIASSFPASLSGMEGDSVKNLPRAEWQAWKKMYDKKQRIERLPIYGDYSIAHPEFIEVDPRIINMSAAIRYSTETDWVVFKGKSIRMKGFQQFNSLSSKLVSSQFYSGKDFSSGDLGIYKYATEPTAGTGNATTWRKIGNNHHFVLVLKQLGQLSK